VGGPFQLYQAAGGADRSFWRELHGTDLKPTLRPQGGYLAFLGRIAPEKGPETAIQIARSVGIPLKIAAKIDRVDERYFREDPNRTWGVRSWTNIIWGSRQGRSLI
jgi:hypothetical protein